MDPELKSVFMVFEGFLSFKIDVHLGLFTHTFFLKEQNDSNLLNSVKALVKA